MKAVVAAFNQEKALVGAFSVISNLRMELFEALMDTLASLNKAGLCILYPVSSVGGDKDQADWNSVLSGARPVMYSNRTQLNTTIIQWYNDSLSSANLKQFSQRECHSQDVICHDFAQLPTNCTSAVSPIRRRKSTVLDVVCLHASNLFLLSQQTICKATFCHE